MVDTRIIRLAESVFTSEYPKVELKKTIGISVDGQDMEIKVWVVDGANVRTFIDEEFTNFGQHYRFSFIPENEFWLDMEHVCDESEYFIEHLRVEWLLMRQGKSYDDAVTEAGKIEKEMRRKHGDIQRVINPVTKLVDPKLFRVKLLKALDNGVKVWMVDGCLVRSVLNIDFVQGGHEYVYSWVPPMDVWVDNDIDWTERGFVILHELHERNKMADGMAYSQAHDESSALELKCRRQVDELQEALMEEGWS